MYLHLITTFNCEIFARCLMNKSTDEALNVSYDGYGQVIASLTNKDWPKGSQTTLFLWVQPHSLFYEYAKALGGEVFDKVKLWQDLDAFCALVKDNADDIQYVFVASLMKPIGRRGLGMLNYDPAVGPTFLIDEMNLHMAKTFAASANIFMLDSDRWIRDCHVEAYSPKMWIASKTPFTNPVFWDAAEDAIASLEALQGKSRRLIIVDADDTLWGGIVGETGWQALALGGHDYIGESFSAFQEALKSLTKRGIQLGIVSKNEENVVLNAIDNHPEMVLSISDFAAWRINWTDKATNIASLVEELNLGFSSVVFIDNDPAERARVKQAIPEVLVPEWPRDPAKYESCLLSLRCFDSPNLTDEDRARGAMYTHNKQRTQSLKHFISLEKWLESSDIKVFADDLNQTNLVRAVQLLNKTNQMNLSTRRLSEIEFNNWAAMDEHEVWTFRVSDKFGDYGLTGIVSLRVDDEETVLEDFLLSCRVMGRKVEETLLHFAAMRAAKARSKMLVANFFQTERNTPVLEFFSRSGFARSGRQFTWIPSNHYHLPDFITLVDNQGG